MHGVVWEIDFKPVSVYFLSHMHVWWFRKTVHETTAHESTTHIAHAHDDVVIAALSSKTIRQSNRFIFQFPWCFQIVYFRNANKKIPKEISIPSCSHPCKIEEFRGRIDDMWLSQKQYDSECRVNWENYEHNWCTINPIYLTSYIFVIKHILLFTLLWLLFFMFLWL